MSPSEDATLARAIANKAQPLRGGDEDTDALVKLAGEARYVLIGEATHGTHEFYRLRAELTQRLVRDHGFGAVAVEADWPDAYRVQRFVRGLGHDRDAREALDDFERFPSWMWRNADVLDFVGWLRAHNERLDPAQQVGFYGLDLYSLHASIAAVLRYLDRVDPSAAQRARYRYSCFEHFGEDAQTYGYASSFGLSADCERAVVWQLLDLQGQRTKLLGKDGQAREDDQFEAEQNARVVKSAEEYYRSMFRERVRSWNLRDLHMADTLDALSAHLERRRSPSRVVVWAHNSHVGDARATQMGDEGEWNLGQLARERHPGETVSIGFSTCAGTVTAASTWGGAAERKEVRPALPGSYEDLFRLTEVPSFLLPLRELGELQQPLCQRRLQRAIGVIYMPESERVSHYFGASLPAQFDALVHIERTRALEPLERATAWGEETPETFPTGM